MEVRGAALLAAALLVTSLAAVPAPASAVMTHDPAPSDATGEHCVESVRRVCVTADPGPAPNGSEGPPDGSDAPAGAEHDRDCPSHQGRRVHVAILDGNATVCVGIVVDPTPDPPTVTVEPPSVDASDTVPDGRSSVGGCGSGDGGSVVVLGNGATLCVDASVGTGGSTFDVDLTPCPSGVDPRVEVAGVIVNLCLFVRAHTDLPGAPDVEPGSVDADVPPPSYSLEPCPRGVDPRVSWLGMRVEVCVLFDANPPTAPMEASECGGGASGRNASAGEATVGACVE